VGLIIDNQNGGGFMSDRKQVGLAYLMVAVVIAIAGISFYLLSTGGVK
jgi:hypothetical protein